MAQFVRIDVRLDEHPSNAWMDLEDIGLHVVGILYCNRNLTDGFIPEASLKKFGSSRRGLIVARRLVTHGTWSSGQRGDERGFWIVGFLNHNDSKAKVLENVNRMKEIGSKGGSRPRSVPLSATLSEPLSEMLSAAAKPLTNAVANAVAGDPPTGGTHAASPVAPAPDSVSQIRAIPRRGTRLPADWQPKTETVAAFAKEGIDAAKAVPEFIDHWLAVAGAKGVKLDWEATFRNRIRQLVDFGRAPRIDGSKPAVVSRFAKPTVQPYTPPVGPKPDLNDPAFAPNFDFTAEWPK